MLVGLGIVASALRRVAGWAIVLLLIAQVVVVALRYVFSFGWPWSLDLLVYLFFVSVLLPGLIVLLSNTSVRVDVLYGGLAPSRRRLVDRIALLGLLAPAMAYAAWASWPNTLRSWQVLESSPTYGGLPGYFALKTCLTLLFAALAVSALVLAFRRDPYGDGSP